MSAPRVHNVLLAADRLDAEEAVRRDSSMANWSVITRESQLYGLMIGEWSVTERAAVNMVNLGRMVRYLKARAAVTEAARARGEIR